MRNCTLNNGSWFLLVYSSTYMRYIVRLDSSRVATLDKVRSATLVSSDDPTRVKSNYIPHILYIA